MSSAQQAYAIGNEHVLFSTCSASISFLLVIVHFSFVLISPDGLDEADPFSFHHYTLPRRLHFPGFAWTCVPASSVWSISAFCPDWLQGGYILPLNPMKVTLPPGLALLNELKPWETKRVPLGKSLLENEAETQRKAEGRGEGNKPLISSLESLDWVILEARSDPRLFNYLSWQIPFMPFASLNWVFIKLKLKTWNLELMVKDK